ncbi:hypothetical protein B0H66DRAFT_535338 [Apodospora peruviana]|uniref:Uncharacterized protein n=1 Tax=Apodospora peruviana TaxID=516989 RepID=A0AAE0M2X1_9PEZI|nr:hypothetical protein B0H66DRAFT_535338 [Apodospora peruviana]
MNKRAAAKQTEENLVVAPSDFWNQELASKIADIVQSKGSPYSADSMIITISVNNRSERAIIKHFKELQIDWPVVEKQLQSWRQPVKLPVDGKVSNSGDVVMPSLIM